MGGTVELNKWRKARDEKRTHWGKWGLGETERLNYAGPGKPGRESVRTVVAELLSLIM